MQPEYFYQEITCLPDHEISTGFVMGKVMEHLHLGLVQTFADRANCSIGLSFPEYRKVADGTIQPETNDHSDTGTVPPIGGKIRLFCRNESDLRRLLASERLSRFSDYVHLTSVRLLERRILNYAIYKRVQIKSSAERLIRRQMKRKGISEVEARQHYAGLKLDTCSLPYVPINSLSSGQKFRLFIDRNPSETTDCWAFSVYGLSVETAVPEF